MRRSWLVLWNVQRPLPDPDDVLRCCSLRRCYGLRRFCRRCLSRSCGRCRGRRSLGSRSNPVAHRPQCYRKCHRDHQPASGQFAGAQFVPDEYSIHYRNLSRVTDHKRRPLQIHFNLEKDTPIRRKYVPFVSPVPYFSLPMIDAVRLRPPLLLPMVRRRKAAPALRAAQHR